MLFFSFLFTLSLSLSLSPSWKKRSSTTLTGEVLARDRLVLVVDRLQAVGGVGDLGGLVLDPGVGRVGLFLEGLEGRPGGERVLFVVGGVVGGADLAGGGADSAGGGGGR